ncbi:MAG: right-handed parallel beta-helix repeat-containing protein [Candidatus Hodarchaeales archaeon]|jgi:parallel beta-helix repeat protein
MRNKNGPMKISEVYLLIILVMWSLLSQYSIIEEEFSKISNDQNTNDHGSMDPLLSLLIQTQYEVHDAIAIDGNADFMAQAIAENWVGDGTPSDPYIIDRYNTSGIHIKNTDLHFRVSNSLLVVSGISLSNVSNGKVSGNILKDIYSTYIQLVWRGPGIILESSENNILTNNTIIYTGWVPDNTWGEPFVLSGNDGIRLINSGNNIITDNNLGIHLINSGNNIITDNNLENASSFILDGEQLQDFIQENVTNNFVNGKLLVYLQNINGGSIPSGAGQVIIVNSTAVEVTGQHLKGLLGLYSSNLLIHNNTLSNGMSGIRLDFSEGSSLTNNRVINGDGIVLSFSGSSTLSNNMVSNNSGYGIFLSASGNSTLSNNMVSNNSYYGIKLEDSRQSIVTNNTVTNNSAAGIQIQSSEAVILINNTVSNNDFEGVGLESSENCALINNTISNTINNPEGIRLAESGNTRIQGNYLFNTQLSIVGLDVEDFLQGTVTNNFVNGKQLIYWQNINGGTVPNGAGQVILVNSVAVEVTGQEVISINSIYCSDLLIQNNIISNGYTGILLDYSEKNTLFNNTITNTGRGSNYESGGIKLYSSSNNIITSNIVTNISYVGLAIDSSSDLNIISANVVTNSTGGIRIESSENNTISANVVTKNSYAGITLSGSLNTFLNNTVTNNPGGIIIGKSEYNTFTNNYITDRMYFANDAALNTVRGNIFIITQLVDNGISNNFVFNFFDNWTDPDVNGDGIVDQPYLIEGTANNQDPFPVVSTVNGHYLRGLELLYPNGGENLNNITTIYWTPAIDSLWFVEDHLITYTIYFSSDNGVTWELITSNLISSSYSWNTTELISGTTYWIKIVASCSAGLVIEDISDDPFRILNFPSNSKKSTHSTDFLTISGLIASFSVMRLLTIRKYRRKRKE